MNRNTLKYIAALAMLVDHISMVFLPIASLPGAGMRVIGRLTAPIMCFFLAEGFRYTSSRKKYGIRLLLAALVSQIPYALLHHGTLFVTDFNVLFTLFFSFLMLIVWEDMKVDPRRYPLVFGLIFISNWCDWGIVGPLFVLFFAIFRDDRNAQARAYSLIAAAMIVTDSVFLAVNHNHWYGELWQLGLYLFLPLLYCYNGEGGSRKPFHKWFFYVFYPLHLAVLYAVKLCI